MTSTWSPDSWRGFPIKQQPVYSDLDALNSVTRKISVSESLVSEAEIGALQTKLSQVAKGEAFLLQGGDCAESFEDFSQPNTESLFRVFLQMAVVLTYAAKMPVVKVGRIGGQYAKPRSNDTETINGSEIPVFRGDMINAIEANIESRRPNPQRMFEAYEKAHLTLNIIRDLSVNGFADLHQANRWNRVYVDKGSFKCRYENLVEKIEDALAFMDACGVDSESAPNLKTIELFSSHEALLMPYESSLIRPSKTREKYFSGSAHMLWVGERTRQLDHAHIEFLSGINNPVGMKVGYSMESDELLQLIEKLNPENAPGKLTLITRMGAESLAQRLPKLLRAVEREGRSVIWSSDPMHGNTVKSSSGYKTRSFDAILNESKTFFDVIRSEGAIPGGVHLEMTGQAVTECTGGSAGILDADLSQLYKTQCDPRLNRDQVLELAFCIAEFIRP